MSGPDGGERQWPEEASRGGAATSGRYPTAGGYPAAGYPGAGYRTAGGYPAAGDPGAGDPGAGRSGGYPGGGYPGSGPAPSGPYSAAPGWDPGSSQRDTGPTVRPIGAGSPRSAARPAGMLSPARILGLVVAVLGALNFVWGFLPELTAPRTGETLSVFAVGPAYVPILLLIAGLLALAAFLPGSEAYRLAVAAVSVGGAAGAIVALGTAGSVQLATTGQVTKGLGAILLVVFGIVQAVVAIGAYVVGAGAAPRTLAPRSAAPGSTPRGVVPGPGSGPGLDDPGVQPGWIPPATWAYQVPVAPGGLGAGGYSRAGYGSSAGYPPGPPTPGGYPPVTPGFGAPASSGSGYPSPDEPVTGPQMVVGAESPRAAFAVTGPQVVAGPESAGADSPGATGGADAVDPGREPADVVDLTRPVGPTADPAGRSRDPADPGRTEIFRPAGEPGS